MSCTQGPVPSSCHLCGLKLCHALSFGFGTAAESGVQATSGDRVSILVSSKPTQDRSMCQRKMEGVEIFCGSWCYFKTIFMLFSMEIILSLGFDYRL